MLSHWLHTVHLYVKYPYDMISQVVSDSSKCLAKPSNCNVAFLLCTKLFWQFFSMDNKFSTDMYKTAVLTVLSKFWCMSCSTVLFNEATPQVWWTYTGHGQA